jgi:hypothetical protein
MTTAVEARYRTSPAEPLWNSSSPDTARTSCPPGLAFVGAGILALGGYGAGAAYVWPAWR